MFSVIKKIINKFSKGLILLLWIYLLAFAAMFAATNSVSKHVFGIFDFSTRFYSFSFLLDDDREAVKPSAELRKYLRRFNSNPPPIESILEKFMIKPHWTDRNIKPKNDGIDIKVWKQAQYRRLFEKTQQKLTLLSLDNTVNLKNVAIAFDEIVPIAFINNEEERVVHSLPAIAINWVIAERPRTKLKKARSQLIDTFVLLMVLGAFGSLIFLTRDYIVYPEDTSIETYIFRPILGMFLAIAMFIVDIAAHTIISQADIFEVRKETLYLLAFAAGLLSEQAYTLVQGRARKVLTPENPISED
jgi:hypothetical protein